MKKQSAKNQTSEQHDATISKLSIVIPCYNESDRIHILIKGIQEFNSGWSGICEFLIVNDGSKDDTSEKIKANPFFKELEGKEKIKLIDLPNNQGKGAALKAGVQAASGTHILTIDADMATPPLEIKKWIKKNKIIVESGHMAVGSRALNKSEINDKPMRKLAGKIFNFIVRFLTPLRVKDSQCGYKFYPAELAKIIFGELQVSGWAHDVEVLYNAHLHDIKIHEMPVKWKSVENSKISLFSDSFKMFIQVLWISLLMKFRYLIKEPIKYVFNYEQLNNGKKKQEAIFRLLFTISAIFLFLFMPLSSFDYGNTGDEWIQNSYGKQVFKYFTEGDTKAIEFESQKAGYGPIIYYSGGFEFLATVVYTTLGTPEYETRHVLNALFGFLAILFAGLLAKLLGGWRAGFLALVFLALTPRFFGHSMNNPKDIPFAAAFIFTIYFLMKMVKEMPMPATRTLIWISLGIAMAINIRIGGLLLIAFMIAFMGFELLFNPVIRAKFKSNFIRFTKYAVLVGGLGYLGGLIFWPYALLNVFSHPIEALGIMSNYVTTINILFEGEHIMSDQVPWYYIPKWLWITLPLFVLAGFIGLLFMIPVWKKQYNVRILILLFFIIIFPVAYAIYKQSSLYDGIRHFLFIIPPVVVVAALGWNLFMELVNKKIVKGLVAGALVIMLFFPFKWMVANYPHHVVYFNPVEGGLKSAYGKYETDYWMNSLKPTVNEFRKIADLENRTDTINVVSNGNYIIYYLDDIKEKINSNYSNYYNRSSKDWDYAIFLSRYINKDQLLNYWPPQNTLYAESADGVPLAVVVERISKEDYYGMMALQQGRYDQAITHFKNYLEVDTTNESVYSSLGMAYLQKKQYAEAVPYLEKAVEIRPDDDQSKINLGMAYLNTQQPGEVITMIAPMVKEAEEAYNYEQKKFEEYRKDFIEDQNNKQLNQDLGETQQKLGRLGSALGQYYYYLGYAYNMIGNDQLANHYMGLAQQFQAQ